MASPSRSYLGAMFAVLGFGVLSLTWFDATVDPYGIYRTRGFPTLPTAPVLWSRVSAAERLDADCGTALLGSSRVVYGFGMTLPNWWGERTCNGALGGTSMPEVRAVTEFLLAETDVPRIVLFLDLHMFHGDRGYNADFPQSRFNMERSSLTYHAWALTSSSALDFATRTIGLRLPGAGRGRAPLGPMAATKREITSYLTSPKLYQRFALSEGHVEDLEAVIDMVAAENRWLLLVIPPVHGLQLETMHESGLWEAQKDWRRRMVQVVADHPGKVVQLWDFASYHEIATEELPIGRLAPKNRFWADVSHMSQLLGLATLTRIRDHWLDRPSVIDDFGVVLTPDNIESHLAELDAGRARYLEEHPEQLEWFHGVVEGARRKRPDAFVDEQDPFEGDL